MNTTPLYNCQFFVYVEPKYAALGISGYNIGIKSFRSFDSFSSAIQTAFSKDLGVGRYLQVAIEYTAVDGVRQGCLTKDNYSDGLSIIENAIEETQITLDELLGNE